MIVYAIKKDILMKLRKIQSL